MIGLVGCSTKKLARPAPARELYSSALFRKSLAYAEPRCERVYVLSGELGLIDLDQQIRPYDHRLARKERPAWGDRVARSLVARHTPGALYLVLAGHDYALPLQLSLHRRGVPTDRILTPLAGMQIGQRLRWLNEQSRAVAA